MPKIMEFVRRVEASCGFDAGKYGDGKGGAFDFSVKASLLNAGDTRLRDERGAPVVQQHGGGHAVPRTRGLVRGECQQKSPRRFCRGPRREREVVTCVI